MKRTVVVTDSNSGLNRERAEKAGIYLLPMPFIIDGKDYLEGVSLSSEDFFSYQLNGADIQSSQPSPSSVCELWDKLLKEYEEIVHIPMSSALSGSCETAKMLSRDYEGRVQVVDNKRISVTQMQSAFEAAKMAEKGMSAAKIRKNLEKAALDASIYITVDTLKYLKKGGRITPAAAAVGELMGIRPVLQIQGERLDAFAKVRGAKKSRQIIMNAIKEDMEGRFAKERAEKRLCLYEAYAGVPEEAEEWKRQIEEMFPDIPVELAELSLSISVHVGKGALGMALAVKQDI